MVLKYLIRQVAAISVALVGATFVYGAIRGGANPNVTDFRLNEVLNDLTRDQTAAQNIVLTTGYVSSNMIVCFNKSWTVLKTLKI